MGILWRFMLKRDRFQLPAWMISISFLTLFVPLAYGEMFATQTDLMGMVSTVENPAMIAMLGPLYDHTFGALYAQTMMVFTALAVATMNIFLVTRHTRADEEEGRLEVLRSLPIGRLTILKATLLNVLLINIVLALILGIGLGVIGMETGTIGSGVTDFWGSMLYGAIMGATGLVFATITAFLVQLSANNRTVLSYGLGFLGATYLLRAVGDMGFEALSLISPLGIILRTEVFVNNHWWPIGIMIITAIAFGVLALYLNYLRDLGAGFIAAKPGRPHATSLLKTNFGLTLKLAKGNLIGWGITTALIGVTYGSVFGDIETFIEGNEMFGQMFADMEGESLTTAFISFLYIIMAMLATIPILAIVLKLKSEERKNRTEHVLSRYVSRFNVLGSYTLIAWLATVFMLLVTAVGLYGASAPMMAEPIPFLTILTALMSYLPALWVLLGFAIFLIGVLPNRTLLAWLYLGYSFFAIYLGQILNLPSALQAISPFGHIANYPIEDVNIRATIMLTVIAILLAAAGFIGYHKRDLQG